MSLHIELSIVSLTVRFTNETLELHKELSAASHYIIIATKRVDKTAHAVFARHKLSREHRELKLEYLGQGVRV